MKSVHDLGLVEALRALRRQLWLVLGVAAAVAAVAVVLSLLQNKEYTAAATVYSRNAASVTLVRGPKSGYKVSLVAPRPDAGREAVSSTRLASLDVVSDRTAKEIGGGLSGEEISSMVEVRPVLESDVLEFRASARRPRLAAELANAFANTYIAFRYEEDYAKAKRGARLVERELLGLPERRLVTSSGQLVISSLRSQRYLIRTMGIIAALQSGNLELVERAKAPPSPSSPKPARNGLLGLVLGLLLGTAIGLTRDRLGARSKSERTVPRRLVDRVASRGYR